MSTRRGFLGKLLGGAALAKVVRFDVVDPAAQPSCKVEEFEVTGHAPQNIGSVSESGDLPTFKASRRTWPGFYNPTSQEVTIFHNGTSFKLPPGEARYLIDGRVMRTYVPRGLAHGEVRR